MNVHKCNFYVFVARDCDEFGKYLGTGLGFKSFRLKGVDVLWRQKNETVVLVLSEVAKPTTPDEMSMLCNYVAAAIIFLDDGERKVQDVLLKLIERECVSIFVHWGGDEWLKHEETAQAALKNSEYGKWSVFAISSTRTTIGMEPGRIPGSKEALEDIVYRCKDAATDQTLTHLAADKVDSALGKCIAELPEAKKEKVRERLKRLKNRLLLSSLKSDKKRKTMEEIQRSENAIRSENVEELKKVAPFLAKILNKEVLNG